MQGTNADIICYLQRKDPQRGYSQGLQCNGSFTLTNILDRRIVMIDSIK